MTFPTYPPAQAEPPLDPRQSLPTMYDLPSEDPKELGLPDTFHLDQPQLLEFTFLPPGWDAEQVFTASDLNLYYDATQPRWHKRPDWFAAVGVPRLYQGRDMRLSYVVWQERVNPFVVVELLSPGTEEDEDLGRTVQQAGEPPTKWQVYEQILRIPYYFVFSRYTDELRAFHLVGGHYEPAKLIDGRLFIPELQLSLGWWQGSYKSMNRLWLRWFTAQGGLILSPGERATAAERQLIESQQQLIASQQQLTESQQREERLAARLRELGTDPEQLV
ncbi:MULTISPECIES: Uma2 family endonuclease [unclassified Microcoleus]|uniref:Uma2 family endonuclease n=1 Tax=unclassified Microcoleus TaxID=2642155 RepID=UPI002FD19F77